MAGHQPHREPGRRRGRAARTRRRGHRRRGRRDRHLRPARRPADRRRRLARELLSFGCALDLHPRSFPAGSSAQTLLGRAAVLLLARDDRSDADGGAVFDLHVRSSFAGYLADWLLDAALEFGGSDVPSLAR
ncbi:sarcosine oxidase subunit gamma family protein [Pseudonocardia sp. ICBG601]|uniref:sarcosine oxidase subunit gamma family protein n=1 Tax=Pseudonocardia sp. ICBG601 TaxID=2846759 RepID=UPI0027E362E6|nr:sarcosine oxidase subunit gamma family protein [Pseudonocardia sp. ICBG601]